MAMYAAWPRENMPVNPVNNETPITAIAFIKSRIKMPSGYLDKGQSARHIPRQTRMTFPRIDFCRVDNLSFIPAKIKDDATTTTKAPNTIHKIINTARISISKTAYSILWFPLYLSYGAISIKL
jgi:hypothetical protein